jgi:cytochrome c oxidase subunit 2
VQSIDPTKVSQTPPFDRPGLRKIADGVYEAYYVAHVFAFDPATITVPAGSRVTFYVTSSDVVHGFSIPETGVNATVEPGWVSSVAHTFTTAGTFLLICNEYCGSGHQLMAAKVIVR